MCIRDRYLLLVKDRMMFDVRYGVLHSAVILEWGSGRLSDSGEPLQLSRPGEPDDGASSWVCVDRVRYSDGAHPDSAPGAVDLWPVDADGLGSSLTRIVPGRYGNDPENWHAAIPSPGAARRRPGR